MAGLRVPLIKKDCLMDCLMVMNLEILTAMHWVCHWALLKALLTVQRMEWSWVIEMGSNLDYLTEIEIMKALKKGTPGALLRSLDSAMENCWAGY